ncbi:MULTISPECIES: hypothetical protein [Enterobacteriaceae]|uniref:hypothetical protein n=1 Tax=Enterobacteriaceae TaxID=543 RepID=UPI0015EA5E68|nr:hypothetical protein [Citrobacter freundii]QLR21535.1 hypothetical protein HV351_18765 [Citrobacter freundii]
MTTNHPAHGPVSLDRLHQISEILSKASAQSDGGNLGYAMADAVKVIDGAIAAFGAEPVAWLHSDNGIGIPAITRSRNVADSWFSKGWNIKPLYTAPPAPLQLPVQRWEELCLQNPDMSIGDAIIRAAWWNHCAAMLQAGNHTEQHLDMVDHSGDANKMVAANSPVTPDGWQLVPKEPTEAMNKAGWDAMNEHDAINPTYRAMLAAAPQQEVKSALEHGMQRYSGAMQKLSEGDR